MPQEKLQRQKNTLKLVYQKDILAHVYVGTPLCPNSFLSARAKAEGYNAIFCGCTELKLKKYLKIRISIRYSCTR